HRDDPHPDLHPFPTRRSSDLGSLKASTENLGDYIQILACLRLLETLDLRPSIYLDRDTELATAPALEACSGRVLLPLNGWFKRRSEEHTSELQSRENLVCRLL